MPKITLSYRREDSDAITGRIFDRLSAVYGRDSLFRDIDNILPGTDFREQLKTTLHCSNILVVVIGSRWLGRARGGRSRINEETDFVRIEVETALQIGIPIIPVLIGKTRMPKAAQLPVGLKDFEFRHAVRVDTGQDFDHHMDRLIRELNRRLEGGVENKLPQHRKAQSIELKASAQAPKEHELKPPGVNKNTRYQSFDYQVWTSSRSIPLISVGIVLFILCAISVVRHDTLGAVLSTICVGFVLPSILRNYEFTRRDGAAIAAQVNSKTLAATLTQLSMFEHGLYGGLVGGLVAGIIVGVVYYIGLSEQHGPLTVVSPIIIFATLSGGLLGALVEGATRKLTQIARQYPDDGLTHAVSGGTIGGILTGLIMGPIGGFYFGSQVNLPEADPLMVLIASGPGVVAVVLAILGYIKPAFSWSLINNAVISVVFCFIVLALCGTVAEAFGAVEAIKDFFALPGDRNHMIGGLYCGVFCGTVWGLAIGIALHLSRQRSPLALAS